MTRDEILPLVLAAMPSLAERWDEFDEDGVDDEIPGGRLAYIDAAKAAFFAADFMADGGTEEVAALLVVVERMLAEGDDDVRLLAAVGYLEDLQNAVMRQPHIGYPDVLPLLGPLGREAWDEVERFWNRD